MSNKSSKDPRAIRRMFDRVAENYDFLNRLLSLGLDRRWRRNLVEEIGGTPVLDLACGSGDVLRRLVDAELGREALGLDFSSNMLVRAREKLGGSNPSVGFVQGDALQLPLADEAVQGVTCAFGVRNFQDRPRAFNELYRVLEADGVLAILEFFPPVDSFWTAPLRWYLGAVLPTLGQYFSTSDDAYDYLKESIEGFVSSESLATELHESGFSRIFVQDEFWGLVKIITARKTPNVDR